MILDLIVLLTLHITVQRQYMGYTNIIASKKNPKLTLLLVGLL